jgi:nitrate reductase delta subunit
MKRTLKVLSALLTYPTKEMTDAVPEFRAALVEEDCLAKKDRRPLELLLHQLETLDLYDLQERYGLLFDRTRSLSLHLFEHVHGESRDRGQAMVDLQQLYEQRGLDVSTTELPDFIPLFLEFLSTIPENEARDLLEEPLHVLEAIRLRLKKRRSSYSWVFSALKALAHAKPMAAAVEALLAEPDPDANDLVALDAAWEEEEVRFGPSAGNPGNPTNPMAPDQQAGCSASGSGCGQTAPLNTGNLNPPRI